MDERFIMETMAEKLGYCKDQCKRDIARTEQAFVKWWSDEGAMGIEEYLRARRVRDARTRDLECIESVLEPLS